MKMSKKYKRLCLTFGLGAALCATVVNAANYTKTLTATYRNIGVTYNGASKTLSAEPFLVDGSTYVPLRAVSEIMGADVKWNGSTNTVAITNTSSDNTALQQQLATANYQVATLQRELETVKKELETYKNSSSSSSSTTGTDITTDELTATETYLINNYYDQLHEDIDLDFALTKKSSRLQLTVSYDSSSEERNYNNDLKDREIENFIEEICEEIAERHAEIEIQGTIEYTRSDLEKASFTYSKSGRLSVDFGIDEDEVEEIISDTYTKLSLPGVGDKDITSIDVSISESSSTITFTLYVNASSSDIKATWNTSLKDTTKLKKQFKAIRDAIQEETDFDVNGELYTSKDSTLLGQYDGTENELNLEEID